MIKRAKVDGVILDIDDGDSSTADIIEIVGDELGDEMDAQRLAFLKRQVKSFGYKIVDKDGKEV